ncbi:DNA polymerase [Bacillus phage Carmen17]|uniref:DNA polymerase n=1 Tax=Bacillus phage Carmen17 TaxID=2072797 RepID=A0A2I7QIM2_9CAUD|nr:DNA polymerase [Bacillus phage Carmen17]AUR81245.1 DNA polymerase [Bacillus phage Carmen17]
MTNLSIDIETYSSVNLLKSGVYKYVESPDFAILIFAYSYDDGPTIVVDLAQGEEVPDNVIVDMLSNHAVKHAFNSAFEMACISKYFDLKLNAKQWRCTMVHALYLGLPGSLDGAASVLKIDAQKDKAGKALIKYFSVPCKATKVNGGRTRNLPEHDPEKWEAFKEYCRQDVVVEKALKLKLNTFPVPDFIWDQWATDHKIVTRGVKMDRQYFMNAIKMDAENKANITKDLIEFMGISNPNSDAQFKEWLAERGLYVSSLAKGEMDDIINGLSEPDINLGIGKKSREDMIYALEQRKSLKKTSSQKFEAMERSTCADDRCRGLLQFYGANRTGRWAGRLVQIQNLPQNKVKDLHTARETLAEGDAELMEMLFGDIAFILSQLVRPAFIPEVGKRFIISDYSAIEAITLAFYAGEQWVLDVFAGDGKIYEATASNMFGVPKDKIVKGNPEYELRAKGKVATLACGYQGGPNALIAMGALKSGIPESELQGIVDAWRKANPNIKKFWYACNSAAQEAVRRKTTVKVGNKGIAYRYEKGTLFADLPSGRSLTYMGAKLVQGDYGDQVEYMGLDQMTKKWGPRRLYGGILVENLIQAIARDCLAFCLENLEEADYPVVMHVHDEVIIEKEIGEGSLEEVYEIMSRPIPWAPGLKLKADGFECEYYQKD